MRTIVNLALFLLCVGLWVGCEAKTAGDQTGVAEPDEPAVADASPANGAAEETAEKGAPEAQISVKDVCKAVAPSDMRGERTKVCIPITGVFQRALGPDLWSKYAECVLASEAGSCDMTKEMKERLEGYVAEHPDEQEILKQAVQAEDARKDL